MSILAPPNIYRFDHPVVLSISENPNSNAVLLSHGAGDQGAA